jgi:hypothetical protein
MENCGCYADIKEGAGCTNYRSISFLKAVYKVFAFQLEE